MIYFTKSTIGYSHIKSNTVCQDYSSTFKTDDRIILTACDGHGGATYVRSDRGSKFASMAAINALQLLDLNQLDDVKYLEKIKLQILCRWNELVEQDLASYPITEDEISNLTDSKKETLLADPVIAYGTTLNAVMMSAKYYVCVQLGDGGVFLIKDLLAKPALPDDDLTAANITYSLCQEDAYLHLEIGVFRRKDFDGVLICTDGLLTPYQSYRNFQEYFVTPMLKKFKRGDRQADIIKFINVLAKSKGVGDDVSMGLIFDEKYFDKKLSKSKTRVKKA